MLQTITSIIASKITLTKIRNDRVGFKTEPDLITCAIFVKPKKQPVSAIRHSLSFSLIHQVEVQVEEIALSVLILAPNKKTRSHFNKSLRLWFLTLRTLLNLKLLFDLNVIFRIR